MQSNTEWYKMKSIEDDTLGFNNSVLFGLVETREQLRKLDK